MRKYRLFDALQTLKDIVETDSFLSIARTTKTAFTSLRKMSFCDMIYFIISSKRRCVQHELDEFFKQKGAESMSRQAFGQAKEKTKPQAIKAINDALSSLPGYNTISEFVVAEVKRERADTDTVGQVMKYVDWVKQEYSFGDYSRIKAYIISYEFSDDIFDNIDTLAKRQYVFGSRPAKSGTWTNLALLKYSYSKKRDFY